jgi:WD40 repeat protein
LQVPVGGLVFSDDGSQMATADYEHVVTLWDVASGRPGICCRGHDAPVFCLAFARGGAVLASGSRNGIVRL